MYSCDVHIIRFNYNSGIDIVESLRGGVNFVHSRLLRHIEHSIHVRQLDGIVVE